MKKIKDGTGFPENTEWDSRERLRSVIEREEEIPNGYFITEPDECINRIDPPAKGKHEPDAW